MNDRTPSYACISHTRWIVFREKSEKRHVHVRRQNGRILDGKHPRFGKPKKTKKQNKTKMKKKVEFGMVTLVYCGLIKVTIKHGRGCDYLMKSGLFCDAGVAVFGS